MQFNIIYNTVRVNGNNNYIINISTIVYVLWYAGISITLGIEKQLNY